MLTTKCQYADVEIRQQARVTCHICGRKPYKWSESIYWAIADAKRDGWTVVDVNRAGKVQKNPSPRSKVQATCPECAKTEVLEYVEERQAPVKVYEYDGRDIVPTSRKLS